MSDPTTDIVTEEQGYPEYPDTEEGYDLGTPMISDADVNPEPAILPNAVPDNPNEGPAAGIADEYDLGLDLPQTSQETYANTVDPFEKSQTLKYTRAMKNSLKNIIPDLESGMRGFIQGGTSEYGDELIANLVSSTTDMWTYDDALAKIRQEHARYAAENTGSYATGWMVGTTLNTLLAGAAMRGATWAGELYQVVPKLSVAAKMFLADYVTGFLRSTGASEQTWADDTNKMLNIGNQGGQLEMMFPAFMTAGLWGATRVANIAKDKAGAPFGKWFMQAVYDIPEEVVNKFIAKYPQINSAVFSNPYKLTAAVVADLNHKKINGKLTVAEYKKKIAETRKIIEAANIRVKEKLQSYAIDDATAFETMEHMRQVRGFAKSKSDEAHDILIRDEIVVPEADILKRFAKTSERYGAKQDAKSMTPLDTKIYASIQHYEGILRNMSKDGMIDGAALKDLNSSLYRQLDNADWDFDARKFLDPADIPIKDLTKDIREATRLHSGGENGAYSKAMDEAAGDYEILSELNKVYRKDDVNIVRNSINEVVKQAKTADQDRLYALADRMGVPNLKNKMKAYADAYSVLKRGDMSDFLEFPQNFMKIKSIKEDLTKLRRSAPLEFIELDDAVQKIVNEKTIKELAKSSIDEANRHFASAPAGLGIPSTDKQIQSMLKDTWHTSHGELNQYADEVVKEIDRYAKKLSKDINSGKHVGLPKSLRNEQITAYQGSGKPLGEMLDDAYVNDAFSGATVSGGAQSKSIQAGHMIRKAGGYAAAIPAYIFGLLIGTVGKSASKQVVETWLKYEALAVFARNKAIPVIARGFDRTFGDDDRDWVIEKGTQEYEAIREAVLKDNELSAAQKVKGVDFIEGMRIPRLAQLGYLNEYMNNQGARKVSRREFGGGGGGGVKGGLQSLVEDFK